MPELTHKFELGQRVFAVRKDTFYRLKNCTACQAKGKITVGDEQFICPKCGGASAYPQNAGRRYYVDIESRIGKVSIEAMHLDFIRYGEPELEVRYMLSATGVGSGQCWKEEQLFATREAAQAFCDCHNLQLPQDEPGAKEKSQQTTPRGMYEFAEDSQCSR